LRFGRTRGTCGGCRGWLIQSHDGEQKQHVQ
jgi:hypothetical protein